jgi:hypothetical protein
MRLRFASILAAGVLAGLVTATFAAVPAAAFHRQYDGHSRGHFDGYPYGQPHYGPRTAYGTGPAYYPPAYPVAYPPVYVAPPPVIAAPVVAAPVVAGPVLPAPIPTTLPTGAASYPADSVAPVAPGTQGTPGCLVVREYTTEIEVGGEAVEGYGYACLQADGSWKRGAPAPVR